jgi:hypothetical protein
VNGLQVKGASTIGQTANGASDTLGEMKVQHIKIIAATLWLITGAMVTNALDLPLVGNIMIAVTGVAPPLIILLLWNDSAPPLSAPIRDERQLPGAGVRPVDPQAPRRGISHV